MTSFNPFFFFKFSCSSMTFPNFNTVTCEHMLSNVCESLSHIHMIFSEPHVVNLTGAVWSSAVSTHTHTHTHTHTSPRLILLSLLNFQWYFWNTFSLILYRRMWSSSHERASLFLNFLLKISLPQGVIQGHFLNYVKQWGLLRCWQQQRMLGNILDFEGHINWHHWWLWLLNP